MSPRCSWYTMVINVYSITSIVPAREGHREELRRNAIYFCEASKNTCRAFSLNKHPVAFLYETFTVLRFPRILQAPQIPHCFIEIVNSSYIYRPWIFIHTFSEPLLFIVGTLSRGHQLGSEQSADRIDLSGRVASSRNVSNQVIIFTTHLPSVETSPWNLHCIILGPWLFFIKLCGHGSPGAFRIIPHRERVIHNRWGFVVEIVHYACVKRVPSATLVHSGGSSSVFKATRVLARHADWKGQEKK